MRRFVAARESLGLIFTGVGLLAMAWGEAWGQDPPVPDSPMPPVSAPAAELPRAEAPATSREAQLEDRIRQLESMVERLSTQMNQMQPKGTSVPAAPSGGTPWPGVSAKPAGPATQNPAAAPGSGFQVDMPAPKVNLPAKAKFGPGFQISSDDDEYQFQFHNLTQVDYRGYFTNGETTGFGDFYRSTFGIPRQWWIFSGRITKQIEYQAVPAFSFDGINLLDAYVNFHYDDRIQLKFGRYKTPFTYEFYDSPIYGLVNPERSLFFNNFALNRETGGMLWGNLFENRLSYAAGVFNGSRNFFVARSPSPELLAYLNFRPFAPDESSALQNFNVGGSVQAGNQQQVLSPNILRDNVAISGSGFFGVPFLGFNNNVRESGPNAFWDLHAAWYYNQLSLLAEWGGGYQPYAFANTLDKRTRVPVNGYYLQAGYFLTGENVTGRGAVKPLQDFNPHASHFGLGAVELAARYSTLELGNQVFTAGFADPNLWTNRVWLLDLGVNWYLNQYMKIYFGWQHFEMADPVIFAPNQRQLTNDMLWLRTQLYF